MIKPISQCLNFILSALVLSACFGVNSPAPTQISEPAGCLEPPDSYVRVIVNGQTLNRRTLAMLAHAKELYGGSLDITGTTISQGSYTGAVSSSLGTHSGGGALDISFTPDDLASVEQDGGMEPLIIALRTAGFAAWLREPNELYDGSAIHIHAIAVGDKELSKSAAEQLTGEAGYFRGKSGLPTDVYGTPTNDRYGGPIICNWMLEMGYRDLQ